MNRPSIELKCCIDLETNSRGHNTTAHVYQGVMLQGIDDTVQKVKLRKHLKSKTLVGSKIYCAPVAFTIWFATGLVLDYFSHTGAVTPLMH